MLRSGVVVVVVVAPGGRAVTVRDVENVVPTDRVFGPDGLVAAADIVMLIVLGFGAGVIEVVRRTRRGREVGQRRNGWLQHHRGLWRDGDLLPKNERRPGIR